MKDFIIKYYGKMRDYMLEANAENADVESISFEVDQLQEEYFNETGQNMEKPTHVDPVRQFSFDPRKFLFFDPFKCPG